MDVRLHINVPVCLEQIYVCLHKQVGVHLQYMDVRLHIQVSGHLQQMDVCLHKHVAVCLQQMDVCLYTQVFVCLHTHHLYDEHHIAFFHQVDQTCSPLLLIHHINPLHQHDVAGLSLFNLSLEV